MTFFSYLKTVAFLLMILIFGPEQGQAQEHTADHSTIQHITSWTELTFEGSKFLTGIKIQMKISSRDCLSGDVSPESKAESAACSGADDDAALLTVLSSAEVSGFSQDQYEENIVFNTTTFRPYKRIRKSNAKEKWVKNYFWEETGVRRQSLQPENSQDNTHPPGNWTKVRTSFYEFPAEASECHTISDPSLLLYILSTFKPDVQQVPVRLCVFGKKQLHRLTIQQEQSVPLNISYMKRTSSEETAVKGPISPVVYSIDVETFAPDYEEVETFSLLGLQKDIRISIDPEKHLPVRVSGINKSIGEIVLNLTKVTDNTSGL